MERSPLGKTSKRVKGHRKGAEGWRGKLEAMNGLKGGSAILDEDEVEQAMEDVLRLARQAAESGSAEAWILLGDLHLVRSPFSRSLRPMLTSSLPQTGHLTLKPNTTTALEAYTKASEGWGLPEAQYKLGFLYGSNFGGAVDGAEGVGKQGSVGRSR